MRLLLFTSFLLAGAGLVVAGCSATRSEAALASESRIDASEVRITPVPLALDGSERVFDYWPHPRFVAFEISVLAGDVLDIDADARSSEARPGLWLTDASFENLVVSNDGTEHAHVHWIVAPSRTGKLYVVLSDFNLSAGQFGIRGTRAHPDEPDAGRTGSDDDAGRVDAGRGTEVPVLVCEPHTWRAPVPARGRAMMAYRDRSFLFADDGKSWAAIANESAVTSPIPLPDGITEMRDVVVEMAPSQRPLVTFLTNNVRHAAFWDGAAFVKTVKLGQAREAHADASERIYTINENGLTELANGKEIVRGAPPYSGTGWTVSAEGTVHVLHSIERPSTIHYGDRAVDLLVTSLPHGSLTWSADSKVTSNEGQGFRAMPIVAAADGSLHTAYGLQYEAYYFRSKDAGRTWASETFKRSTSKATLVDPAPSSTRPEDVGGNIRLLAAQDYDHVSITLMSYSSFYFMRRCAPVDGVSQPWPAERLAFSGEAFNSGAVAVSERGLATILTTSGARQDAPVTP